MLNQVKIVLIVLISELNCYHKVNCDFEEDFCFWKSSLSVETINQWTHSSEKHFNCETYCSQQSNRFIYITFDSMVSTKLNYVRLIGQRLTRQITSKCTLTLRYIGYGLGWANLIIGFQRVSKSTNHFHRNQIVMEPLMVIPTSISTSWHQITVPLIVSDHFYPVIQVNLTINNRINDGSMINLNHDQFKGFIAIDDTVFSENCFQPSTELIEDKSSDSSLDDENDEDGDQLGVDFVEKMSEKILLELNETRVRTFERNFYKISSDNHNENHDNHHDNHHEDHEDHYDLSVPRKVWNPLTNWCDQSIVDCFKCLNYVQIKFDQSIRCPTICDLNTIDNQQQFTDNCGWTQNQLSSKISTWILVTPYEASRYVINYPTMDADSVIDSDEQFNTGKYLILNIINESTDYNNLLPPISLNSPIYISTRSTCYFTFSYLIYDRSAIFYLKLSTINVDQSERRSSSPRKIKLIGSLVNHDQDEQLILWKGLFSSANHWKNGSAYIGKHDKPFVLSFIRTSSRYSKFGTIALDNFNFIAC